MKTNKAIMIVLLTTAVFLLAADSTEAAHRWRRTRSRYREDRASWQESPQNTVRNDAPYQQYRRWEWVYPQYIGAFHYRDFQNLGVPTGDRGFRGTPW